MTIKAMAIMRQVAEMGRGKKMEKLPLDLIRDCRRAVSIIGPRTKARTMLEGMPEVSNGMKAPWAATPSIALMDFQQIFCYMAGKRISQLVWTR
jgi:hypothetical protein